MNRQAKKVTEKLQTGKVTKDIYDLELHEEVQVGHGFYALRVPGGWIYNYWSVEEGTITMSNFVPFNNEFQ